MDKKSNDNDARDSNNDDNSKNPLKDEKQTRRVDTKNQMNNKEPEVRQHPSGGQLESFNIVATGLGDMEASDSTKKMNKRSRNKFGFISSNGGDGRFELVTTSRASGAQAAGELSAKYGDIYYPPKAMANDELFPVSLRSLATPSRYDIGIVLPHVSVSSDSQHQPHPYGQNSGSPLVQRLVLIEKRAEELVDEIPVQQSLEDISEETSVAEQVAPSMGEFGSKISLLTMRKVPSVLTARYGHLFGPSLMDEPSMLPASISVGGGATATTPSASSSHDEDAETLSSQVFVTATEPPVSRHHKSRAHPSFSGSHDFDIDQYNQGKDEQQQQFDLQSLRKLNPSLISDPSDANYLPRFARASYMK